MLQRLLYPPVREPASLFMRGNPRYADYDIGEFTYGRPTVLTWGERATLRIGRFCSIADQVTIFLGGEHRIDWLSTYPFVEMLRLDFRIEGHPWSRGDVIIGNDVWIGRGAVIRSGVRIGDGAVIGTGALCTKNVEPYTVVAGNPAKVVRKRFEESDIAELLRIKWWDWPIDRIIEAVPYLMRDDVGLFLQHACCNHYLSPSDKSHGSLAHCK